MHRDLSVNIRARIEKEQPREINRFHKYTIVTIVINKWNQTNKKQKWEEQLESMVGGKDKIFCKDLLEIEVHGELGDQRETDNIIQIVQPARV